MNFENEKHCYFYCRKILKGNGFSDLDILALGQGFQAICHEVYDLQKTYGNYWSKIHLKNPTKVLVSELQNVKEYTVEKILELLMILSDVFTLYERISINKDNKEVYETLYKMYGKFDFQDVKKKLAI